MFVKFIGCSYRSVKTRLMLNVFFSGFLKNVIFGRLFDQLDEKR